VVEGGREEGGRREGREEEGREGKEAGEGRKEGKAAYILYHNMPHLFFLFLYSQLTVYFLPSELLILPPPPSPSGPERDFI
jgi:hypothetical protein